MTLTDDERQSSGRNHLMTWIHPSIKKEPEAHFRNDEGFKHRRLTNVANRASPRPSKCTSGSATFMKMKSRCLLSKSLNCEAILVETFKYTHTLKANKKRFADEWSGAHYEDYVQRLEVTTQQYQPPSGNDKASSMTSVVDFDWVWRETASEPHKNHHFRLGSFFANDLCSFALAASSTFASATNPTDSQEVVDLREEVQKLTQELHQQAEQSDKMYNVTP
ncbi:hypothetical protein Ahy_A01g003390 [Arachis hypogaea]|uniref:Uncharacterized protein n=1 Tax=Arachis hypogaea TaxID=3818 RepID=A0A445ESV4_ARAHY|nr:hypothetical protein Ahy_A01g003390 [Arachis hypogaea]